MTADLMLPTSGTFDIAVVAAGQTSCLQHLLVGQVTIDAGEQSTVVVMGVPGQDGGPSALTMAGFVDDSSPSPNPRESASSMPRSARRTRTWRPRSRSAPTKRCWPR